MKTRLMVVGIILAAVVMSGCLTGVKVSGGPQIYTPNIPKLRGGLFPPQLMYTVVNTTEFTLVVNAVSALDDVTVKLGQGQKVTIPLRQFTPQCRDVSIIVSAYHPASDVYVTSSTRQVCVSGGQNRTDVWQVRRSGNPDQYTIY